MRIYIDLDTVLNDLDAVWLQYCNEKTGKDHKPNEILDWKWSFRTYGDVAGEFFNTNFYHRVRPRIGAKKFLEDLTDLGLRPIIISSPVYDEKREKDLKEKWIRERLGVYELIVSSQKYLWTGPYVLIDDNIKNCLLHIFNNEADAILFNPDGEFPYALPLPTENFNGKLRYQTKYDDIIESIRGI